jgi:hypothetical protein
MMANETIKAVGDQGKIVALVVETATYKVPSVDAQWKAFQQRLNSQSHIQIVAVRKFRMNAMAFAGMYQDQLFEPSIGLTPEQFDSVVDENPGVNAIVSFIGVPPFSPEEIDSFKAKGIKLLIVSSQDAWLGDMLQKGVVQLAVVPKADGLRDQKVRTFENTYDIFTPENYPHVPGPK